MVIDLPVINKYLAYIGLALVVIIETNMAEEFVKISLKLMRRAKVVSEYTSAKLFGANVINEGIWVRTRSEDEKDA